MTLLPFHTGRLLRQRRHIHPRAAGRLGDAGPGAADGDVAHILLAFSGRGNGDGALVRHITGGVAVRRIAGELLLGEGHAGAAQAGGDGGTGVGHDGDTHLSGAFHRHAAGGRGLLDDDHLAGDLVDNGFFLVLKGEGVEPGFQVHLHAEHAFAVALQFLAVEGQREVGVGSAVEVHLGLLGGVGALFRGADGQVGEDVLLLDLVRVVAQQHVGGAAHVLFQRTEGTIGRTHAAIHRPGLDDLTHHLIRRFPAGFVAAQPVVADPGGNARPVL